MSQEVGSRAKEAEPKYLLAIRPVPPKPVEKHCTGVAALDPPLVAGSLSPTAVFLSWGPEPHREGGVMEECLEEGFYTVRYRRRGGPWAHQSSPTAAAVLAGLRPASRYEFRVRATRGQRHGPWSAPLLHSTGPGGERGPGERGTRGEGDQGRGDQGRGGEGTRGEGERGTRGEGTRGEGVRGEGDQGRGGEGTRGEGERGPGERGPGERGEGTRGEVDQGRGDQRRGDQGTGTRGPGDQRTRGPGDQGRGGPEDQTTRREGDQGRGGPGDQRTRGEGDQGRGGPGDQRTRGEGDQGRGERGRGDQGTRGEDQGTIGEGTRDQRRGDQGTIGEGTRGPGTRGEGTRGEGDQGTRDQRRGDQGPGTRGEGTRGPGTRGVETVVTSQRKAVQMGSPPASPLKPLGPRAMFPPRPALYNRTRPPLSSLVKHQTFPGSPRTSFANRDPLRPLVLPRPVVWSRPRQGKKRPPPLQGKHHPPPLHGYPVRPAIPVDKIPNLVGELGDKDQLSHWKQTERLSGVKPNLPAATPRPKGQEERQITRTNPTPTSTPTTTTTSTPTPTTTTTTNPTTTTSTGRLDLWEESEVFSSQPNSDLDALGKKRFVAPHVVYKTDKRPEEPCSVTSSLLFFPGEKPGESDASTPPQAPPSNLTVVTVEGCPSFVILDWKNTDNHTQEYEVISTATGPDGEEVSVLTTDQTHTVVENLRPESSYAFKVKPKNDLGAGPPSELVTFSTESADPRVSENASGKDAIWTRFPFRTEPPSDCTGPQYVKRTWYRKFVGVQLCNSLRYKIYLSDSLTGQFYDIGDEAGFGEDHCQFVDSFLDGRTGPQLRPQQLPPRTGFYRAARQEPVRLGPLGAGTAAGYVSWYECGTPIPGRW
ncbi:unnamed protein product [Arctogadus glacialis]